MNPATRGMRNAFRNVTRTISIVFILGLSIGLSLVMLIANQAVDDKIKKTLTSIGNTISIQPAGFMGSSSVNNALSTDDISSLNGIDHIKNITKKMVDHVQPEGTTSQLGTPLPGSKVLGAMPGDSTSGATTSLQAPFSVDCDKGKCSGGGLTIMAKGPKGDTKLPSNFSTPIDFVGTNNPTNAKSVSANTLELISGQAIDPSKDNNEAMISSDMASKNNLQVGSTFTAYNTTLTVVGIFKSDTQLGNSSVILSLATAQRLSQQTDTLTGATITVDSLENLDGVVSAIKAKLGTKADVTSSQEEAGQALAPLQAVKKISMYSLIGSVGAGAIIILLTMIMIVRERKREIGVIKAIGASNVRIILQFLFEAVTLTSLGALMGVVIGLVASTPVTSALITNTANGADMGPPNPILESIGDISQIQAVVSWPILLYGFGVALLISAVGSVLTAGLIAKVRPSEVLRSE